MRAERLAEAALLRARGQEQAQSLRAIADRQAVEIVAAATRDAEIIRGTGDAERNRIYANAYGQDPEFFEFYRSMESYLTALSGTGTTMVLSPQSEFFRYFGSDGELPAASTNLPIPLPPAQTEIPSTTDEPALDGLGIEETVPPSIELEDGTTLQPTEGTSIPAPLDEPAAPLEDATPAEIDLGGEAPADGTPATDAPAVVTEEAPADAAPATVPPAETSAPLEQPDAQ